MSLKFLTKRSIYRNNVIAARNLKYKFETLSNTRSIIHASFSFNEHFKIPKKLFSSKINYICGSFKRDLTYSSSTSSKLDEKENNELTVVKSKRLMRLIYARVHPDLYTNHFQAQVILLF